MAHIRNEACPECRKIGKDRSGDNLGVYDDGGKYCYSCGYREVSGVKYKLNKGEIIPVTESKSTVFLPDDCTSLLPDAPLQWLDKYDFNAIDIVSNKLMWSCSRRYLIFPIFDEEHNILAWQARYFGENVMHPKWISFGALKDILHILPTRKHHDKIVLVEDIVSAIKISHVASAMPIFGSHIGYERFIRLRQLTDNVVVWLDPDKRVESMKEIERASKLGMKRKLIFSDKDPKEYKFSEIEEFLND